MCIRDRAPPPTAEPARAPEAVEDGVPAMPPPAPREFRARTQGWRPQPPRGAKPSEGQRVPLPPAPMPDDAHAPRATPARSEPFMVAVPPARDDGESPFAPSAPWPAAPIVAPAGHAPFRPEVRGELGPLIDALKDLFACDRVVASQGSSVRCGICYLYHKLGEVEYREAEGFYVCLNCRQALGTTALPMLRRQQR